MLSWEDYNNLVDFGRERSNQKRLGWNLIRWFPWRRMADKIFARRIAGLFPKPETPYKFRVAKPYFIANNTLLGEQAVPGVKLSDEDELKRRGTDLNELRAAIAHELFRQIFIDGFYHADPHAGNIFIDGRTIYFIDLGAATSSSRENRRLLQLFLGAIAQRNSDVLKDFFNALAPGRGERLVAEANPILTGDRSVASRALSILQMMEDEGVDLPDEFMAVFRFLGAGGLLFEHPTNVGGELFANGEASSDRGVGGIVGWLRAFVLKIVPSLEPYYDAGAAFFLENSLVFIAEWMLVGWGGWNFWSAHLTVWGAFVVAHLLDWLVDMSRNGWRAPPANFRIASFFAALNILAGLPIGSGQLDFLVYLVLSYLVHLVVNLLFGQWGSDRGLRRFEGFIRRLRAPELIKEALIRIAKYICEAPEKITPEDVDLLFQLIDGGKSSNNTIALTASLAIDDIIRNPETIKLLRGQHLVTVLKYFPRQPYVANGVGVVTPTEAKIARPIFELLLYQMGEKATPPQQNIEFANAALAFYKSLTDDDYAGDFAKAVAKIIAAISEEALERSLKRLLSHWRDSSDPIVRTAIPREIGQLNTRLRSHGYRIDFNGRDLTIGKEEGRQDETGAKGLRPGAAAVWHWMGEWLMAAFPEPWRSGLRPFVKVAVAVFVEGSLSLIIGARTGYSIGGAAAVLFILFAVHLIFGFFEWNTARGDWRPRWFPWWHRGLKGMGQTMGPILIAWMSLACFAPSLFPSEFQNLLGLFPGRWQPVLQGAAFLAYVPHLIINVWITFSEWMMTSTSMKYTDQKNRVYEIRPFLETRRAKNIAGFVERYYAHTRRLQAPKTYLGVHLLEGFDYGDVDERFQELFIHFWRGLYEANVGLEHDSLADLLGRFNEPLMKMGLYVELVQRTEKGETFRHLRFSKIDMVRKVTKSEKMAVVLHTSFLGSGTPTGKVFAFAEPEEGIAVINRTEAHQRVIGWFPEVGYGRQRLSQGRENIARQLLLQDVAESKIADPSVVEAFLNDGRPASLDKRGSVGSLLKALFSAGSIRGALRIIKEALDSRRFRRLVDVLSEALTEVEEIHELSHAFHDYQSRPAETIRTEHRARLNDLRQARLIRWLIASTLHYVAQKLEEGKPRERIYGYRAMSLLAQQLLGTGNVQEPRVRERLLEALLENSGRRLRSLINQIYQTEFEDLPVERADVAKGHVLMAPDFPLPKVAWEGGLAYGGIMVWMRDWLFPSLSLREYGSRKAWWVENLFAWGVGAVVGAVAFVLTGDLFNSLQIVNITAWTSFVGGHVYDLLRSKGQRPPPANLLFATLIAVINITLPSLAMVVLPSSLFALAGPALPVILFTVAGSFVTHWGTNKLAPIPGKNKFVLSPSRRRFLRAAATSGFGMIFLFPWVAATGQIVSSKEKKQNGSSDFSKYEDALRHLKEISGMPEAGMRLAQWEKDLHQALMDVKREYEKINPTRALLEKTFDVFYDAYVNAWENNGIRSLAHKKVVNALATFGPALIDVAERKGVDSDEFKRRLFSFSLVELNCKEEGAKGSAIQAFKRLAGHENVRVRKDVVKHFIRGAPAEAMKVFCYTTGRGLSDSEDDVRNEISYCISRFVGVYRELEPFADLIMDTPGIGIRHPDSRTRFWTWEVIAELARRNELKANQKNKVFVFARKTTAVGLNDPDERVQGMAFMVLFELDRGEVAKQIFEHGLGLIHQNVYIRQSAAQIVADVGLKGAPDSALSYIFGKGVGFNDPDQGVRLSIVKAFGSASGRIELRCIEELTRQGAGIYDRDQQLADYSVEVLSALLQEHPEKITPAILKHMCHFGMQYNLKNLIEKIQGTEVVRKLISDALTGLSSQKDLIPPKDVNLVLFATTLKSYSAAEKSEFILRLYLYAQRARRKELLVFRSLAVMSAIVLLSDGEKADLDRRYPDIRKSLAPLFSSAKLPYDSLYGGKKKNHLTIRAYAPLEPESLIGVFKKKLGLQTIDIKEIEPEKYMLQGTCNDKSVTVHVDTSGDPKDYKKRFLEKLDETDIIIYWGHAGMGASLAFGLDNAPETDLLMLGTKLIICMCCSSAQNYAGEIAKRLPGSHGVFSTMPSHNPSDAWALEAIIDGITKEKDWATIEKGVKQSVARDPNPVDYLFPHDIDRRLKYVNFNPLSDGQGGGDIIYLPTTDTVLLQDQDSFELIPGRVEVDRIVSNKVREVVQKVAYFFNWNDVLKGPGIQIEPGEFELPTGDETNVAFVKDMPGENGARKFRANINASYRHSSKAVLVMMILYELNNHISRERNKNGQLTPYDTLRGLQMVAEFAKTHNKEALYEPFLAKVAKVGLDPNTVPLSLLLQTLNTHSLDDRREALQMLLRNLGIPKKHEKQDLKAQGLLSEVAFQHWNEIFDGLVFNTGIGDAMGSFQPSSSADSAFRDGIEYAMAEGASQSSRLLSYFPSSEAYTKRWAWIESLSVGAVAGSFATHWGTNKLASKLNPAAELIGLLQNELRQEKASAEVMTIASPLAGDAAVGAGGLSLLQAPPATWPLTIKFTYFLAWLFPGTFGSDLLSREARREEMKRIASLKVAPWFEPALTLGVFFTFLSLYSAGLIVGWRRVVMILLVGFTSNIISTFLHIGSDSFDTNSDSDMFRRLGKIFAVGLVFHTPLILSQIAAPFLGFTPNLILLVISAAWVCWAFFTHRAYNRAVILAEGPVWLVKWARRQSLPGVTLKAIRHVAGGRRAEFEELFRLTWELQQGEIEHRFWTTDTLGRIIPALARTLGGRAWIMKNSLSLAIGMVKKGIEPFMALESIGEFVQVPNAQEWIIEEAFSLANAILDKGSLLQLDREVWRDFTALVRAGEGHEWLVKEGLSLFRTLIEKDLYEGQIASLFDRLGPHKDLLGKILKDLRSLEDVILVGAINAVAGLSTILVSNPSAWEQLILPVLRTRGTQAIGIFTALSEMQPFLASLGDLNGFLGRLERVIPETRGRFDADNPWHRAANYYDLSLQGMIRGASRLLSWEDYNNLVDRSLESSGPDIPIEHHVQLKALAYEGYQLAKFIERLESVAVPQGREVVVVANKSYGRVALDPIRLWLERKGIRVIETKIGSTDAHANPFVIDFDEAPLFTDEELKYFAKQQPYVVVVDGSYSLDAVKMANLNRQEPRFPDAYQGYRNWFLALNEGIRRQEAAQDPDQFQVDGNHLSQLMAQDKPRVIAEKARALSVHSQDLYRMRFWTPAFGGKPGKLGFSQSRQMRSTVPTYFDFGKDSSGATVIMVQSAIESPDHPLADLRYPTIPPRIQEWMRSIEFASSSMENDKPTDSEKRARQNNIPAFFDDRNHFAEFNYAFDPLYGVVPNRLYAQVSQHYFEDLGEFLGEKRFTKSPVVSRHIHSLDAYVFDLTGTLTSLRDPIPDDVKMKLEGLLRWGKKVAVVTDDTTDQNVEGRLINRIDPSLRKNLSVYLNGGNTLWAFSEEGERQVVFDRRLQEGAVEALEQLVKTTLPSLVGSSFKLIATPYGVQIDLKGVPRPKGGRASIIESLEKNARRPLKIYKLGKNHILLALRHKSDAVQDFLDSNNLNSSRLLISGNEAGSRENDREMFIAFPQAVKVNVGGISRSLLRESGQMTYQMIDGGIRPLFAAIDDEGNLMVDRLEAHSYQPPRRKHEAEQIGIPYRPLNDIPSSQMGSQMMGTLSLFALSPTYTKHWAWVESVGVGAAAGALLAAALAVSWWAGVDLASFRNASSPLFYSLAFVVLAALIFLIENHIWLPAHEWIDRMIETRTGKKIIRNWAEMRKGAGLLNGAGLIAALASMPFTLSLDPMSAVLTLLGVYTLTHAAGHHIWNNRVRPEAALSLDPSIHTKTAAMKVLRAFNRFPEVSRVSKGPFSSVDGDGNSFKGMRKRLIGFYLELLLGMPYLFLVLLGSYLLLRTQLIFIPLYLIFIIPLSPFLILFLLIPWRVFGHRVFKEAVLGSRISWRPNSSGWFSASYALSGLIWKDQVVSSSEVHITFLRNLVDRAKAAGIPIPDLFEVLSRRYESSGIGLNRVLTNTDFWKEVSRLPPYRILSAASAVWELMKRFSISEEHIGQLTSFVLDLRRRPEVANRVVYDHWTPAVNVIHKEARFKKSDLEEIQEKADVQNIQSFKGPEFKQKAIDAIIKIKGPLTINFYGHGLPEGFFLSGNIFITPGELAEVLAARPHLEQVVLIFNCCYSYDIAVKLYVELSRLNVAQYPLVITSSHRHKVSYGGMLEDAISAVGEIGSPLLVEKIYHIEHDSQFMKWHDPALFIPLTAEDTAWLNSIKGTVPYERDAAARLPSNIPIDAMGSADAAHVSEDFILATSISVSEASIANDQAKTEWGENSWKYWVYTITNHVWEGLFMFLGDGARLVVNKLGISRLYGFKGDMVTRSPPFGGWVTSLSALTSLSLLFFNPPLMFLSTPVLAHLIWSVAAGYSFSGAHEESVFSGRGLWLWVFGSVLTAATFTPLFFVTPTFPGVSVALLIGHAMGFFVHAFYNGFILVGRWQKWKGAFWQGLRSVALRLSPASIFKKVEAVATSFEVQTDERELEKTIMAVRLGRAISNEILGHPTEKVVEFINKVTRRALKPGDFAGLVKINYFAEGYHKFVFQVTFEMKRKLPFKVLVAVKNGKDKDSISNEELADLRQLSGVTEHTPRFGDIFHYTDEAGDFDYYIEEFIDGPTAQELKKQGELNLQRRNKVVHALLEISAWLGKMPKDIHANNFVLTSQSKRTAQMRRGGRIADLFSVAVTGLDQLLKLVSLSRVARLTDDRDEMAVMVDLGQNRVDLDRSLLRLISFYGYFGNERRSNRFIFQAYLDAFRQDKKNGMEILKMNLAYLKDRITADERKGKRPGATSLRKKEIREERLEPALQKEDVRIVIQELEKFIADRESPGSGSLLTKPDVADQLSFLPGNVTYTKGWGPIAESFGVGAVAGSFVIHWGTNKIAPKLSPAAELIGLLQNELRQEKASSEVLRRVTREFIDGERSQALKVGEKTASQPDALLMEGGRLAESLIEELQRQLSEGRLTKEDVERMAPILAALLSVALTGNELSRFLVSLDQIRKADDPRKPVYEYEWLPAGSEETIQEAARIAADRYRAESISRSVEGRLILIADQTSVSAVEKEIAIKKDTRIRVVNESRLKSVWDLLKEDDGANRPEDLVTMITRRINRFRVRPGAALERDFFNLASVDELKGMDPALLHKLQASFDVILILNAVQAIRLAPDQLPTFEKLRKILIQA
ncbi:MAG: hypothetical protein LHV69_05515 [Elusimicrobia bacterium]|nr:hypothetical protein [Candidatus Obscuribacterium magneticum]